MREHLVVAAIAVVLPTPRLWASSSTPFSLGDQGGIILDVTLNGLGPFKMLLDTGATHSAITADVAERIGARIVAHENTKLWLGADFEVEWEGRKYEPRPKHAWPNDTF